jgi:hypothetical protein
LYHLVLRNPNTQCIKNMLRQHKTVPFFNLWAFINTLSRSRVAHAVHQAVTTKARFCSIRVSNFSFLACIVLVVELIYKILRNLTFFFVVYVVWIITTTTTNKQKAYHRLLWLLGSHHPQVDLPLPAVPSSLGRLGLRPGPANQPRPEYPASLRLLGHPPHLWTDKFRVHTDFAHPKKSRLFRLQCWSHKTKTVEPKYRLPRNGSYGPDITLLFLCVL